MQAAAEEGVFAESEAWAERERELLAQLQAASEHAIALQAELEKLTQEAAAKQDQVCCCRCSRLSMACQLEPKARTCQIRAVSTAAYANLVMWAWKLTDCCAWQANTTIESLKEQLERSTADLAVLQVRLRPLPMSLDCESRYFWC